MTRVRARVRRLREILRALRLAQRQSRPPVDPWKLNLPQTRLPARPGSDWLSTPRDRQRALEQERARGRRLDEWGR